jgi:hypothetical protein
MILPTKDEFVRLAEDHDVVPAARAVYLDLVTPISAFMALGRRPVPGGPMSAASPPRHVRCACGPEEGTPVT